MSQIPFEIAKKELKDFLSIHLKKEFRKGKLTDEKIEDDYPDVLDAIQDGLLFFDEKNKPTYSLRYPLKNEDGEVSVSVIEFRSRIKGADRIVLMNGIDPKKQLGDYMIKVISYMTQLDSNSLVKKLEKEDFEVLNQICSVF